jgi:predicted DNA-binding ArsR family transcriptional regulator
MGVHSRGEPLNRIKVISEPAELAPMLRAVDTEVKRKVFTDVSVEWRTLDDVEKKFGKKGREALLLFEKMKLVEAKWQSETGQAQPQKSFHTYYTSFHINTTAPIAEISDVLAGAAMPDKEFEKLETKILEIVGRDGRFTGDIADALGISAMLLKSLVKRSIRLEYRGHRVEKAKVP